MWIKRTYGRIGEVKITRGKYHEYLGMKLDSSQAGSIKIDMVDYLNTMVESFPSKYLGGAKVSTPFNKSYLQLISKVPSLVRKTRSYSIQ